MKKKIKKKKKKIYIMYGCNKIIQNNVTVNRQKL